MRPFNYFNQAYQNSTTWLGYNNWAFLYEVMLRSFIMFVVVLVSMRILGKRGVMQLSVFELVTILILGSAAGDPMLYHEVGILPACIVFIMVVVLYRTVIFFLSKSRKFEVLIKGRPQYLIREGRICIEDFKKEPLALDEFYAELRMQHVSQLGQVKYAVIETSGEISLFFYPPGAVTYGLPIMPGAFDAKTSRANTTGYYSCIYCGNSEQLEAGSDFTCTQCSKHNCIPSSNEERMK